MKAACVQLSQAAKPQVRTHSLRDNMLITLLRNHMLRYSSHMHMRLATSRSDYSPFETAKHAVIHHQQTTAYKPSTLVLKPHHHETSPGCEASFTSSEAPPAKDNRSHLAAASNSLTTPSSTSVATTSDRPHYASKHATKSRIHSCAPACQGGSPELSELPVELTYGSAAACDAGLTSISMAPANANTTSTTSADF